MCRESFPVINSINVYTCCTNDMYESTYAVSAANGKHAQIDAITNLAIVFV